MPTHDLRKDFLRFFEKKSHRIVRSSSLIPANDPTLMFTNAGMNQFKDFFLGLQKPDYNRATTCQKVMRAGGKHNDLDNVGKTPRHHTFFEMLGNFSFGDYFKEQAIEFAWEFLTVNLKIPIEKLAVSVFEEDDESVDLWMKITGIGTDRIAGLSAKDNFWQMGDTGPCGPCSEIHFDLYGVNGKSAVKSLEDDDGRFLEIWNLVFMQYDRSTDGKMTPLPSPSIDTGMGLERILSVVEGVESNFDTSLFKPLIGLIADYCGKTYGADEKVDTACRIIADHIRSLTFLISDGVIPANEGSGYVLRRILRRASRYAKDLDASAGVLADISSAFIPMMSDTYPELKTSESMLRKIIKSEEVRFATTLNYGLSQLRDLISSTKGNKIDASEIFKLYDTYGFPLDLTKDILDESGYEFDENDFNKHLNVQKQTARDNRKMSMESSSDHSIYLELQKISGDTVFCGYDHFDADTKLTGLLVNGKISDRALPGDKVEAVLSHSPFYAESGGQIGDSGYVISDNFTIRITGTKRPIPGYNISAGVVESTIEKDQSFIGQKVQAKIDTARRENISRHHTSTHLLNNSLRNILGEHIKQSGSLVTDNKLRFDFTHYSPLNSQELEEVETYMNSLIRENYEVSTKEMSIDDALDSGALAFFGDKYGSNVRVVKAGPSIELCGGTHVKRTGDIALIKIVMEAPVAAGIRRIEAVAGEAAVKDVIRSKEILDSLGKELKAKPDELIERFILQKEKIRDLEGQVKNLKVDLFTKSLIDQNAFVKCEFGEMLLFEADSPADLNLFGDILKKSHDDMLALIYSKTKESFSALYFSGNKLHDSVKAGSLGSKLVEFSGAKGGGNDQIARYGGSNVEAFREYLKNLALS